MSDEKKDEISNHFVVDVTNSFLSKATILFVNSGEWKRIEGGILDAIDAEVEGTDLDKRYLFRYGNVSKFEMWKDEGQDEGLEGVHGSGTSCVEKQKNVRPHHGDDEDREVEGEHEAGERARLFGLLRLV